MVTPLRVERIRGGLLRRHFDRRFSVVATPASGTRKICDTLSPIE